MITGTWSLLRIIINTFYENITAYDSNKYHCTVIVFQIMIAGKEKVFWWEFWCLSIPGRKLNISLLYVARIWFWSLNDIINLV